jgi:ubiquitin-like domain-containing CTD phosphatase 1
MNEPRQGKRLLVLDLDYSKYHPFCVTDKSSGRFQASPRWITASKRMRSSLHARVLGAVSQVLIDQTDERCYEHYDIVIWSQTHWRWLESKLVELEIVGGPHNYKISFVVDRQPMFPVFTLRGGGQMQKHEVKALSYIWAQYPQWGRHNVSQDLIRLIMS